MLSVRAHRTTVAVVEYCAHEMVFADLCAICGKTINSSDKQATISLIPSQPALTVSRAVWDMALLAQSHFI